MRESSLPVTCTQSQVAKTTSVGIQTSPMLTTADTKFSSNTFPSFCFSEMIKQNANKCVPIQTKKILQSEQLPITDHLLLIYVRTYILKKVLQLNTIHKINKQRLYYGDLQINAWLFIKKYINIYALPNTFFHELIQVVSQRILSPPNTLRTSNETAFNLKG